MKKRILSLIMCILMFATMVPSQVFAASSLTVTFTQEPEDVTVNPGEDAVFTAKAKVNKLTGTIKYLWVDASTLETDGELSFKDISNVVSKAVGTGETLTLSNVALTDNGKTYKCLAYCYVSLSEFGYAVSEVVTLNVVAKPCAEHNLIHHAAVEPTCTSAGSTEYWQCSMCTRVYSDANAQNEILIKNTNIPKNERAHSIVHIEGVEATCTTEGNIDCWQCTRCEKYFQDELATQELKKSDVEIDKNDNHHLVRVDAVESTCAVKGHIGYYECTLCNKMFSDQNATSKLKSSDVELAKKDHTYAWTVDEGGSAHYKKCTGCGAIESGTTGEHVSTGANKACCTHAAFCDVCGFSYGEKDKDYHPNLETKVIKKATQYSDGRAHVKCPDCGYEEMIDLKYQCPHSSVKYHPEVEATCQAEGTIEYWECEACGKIFAEETCETQLTVSDITVAKVEHYISLTSLGKEIANTSVCEQAYDATGHWQQCKYCGYKFMDTFSTHTILTTSSTPTCCTGTTKCLLCNYTSDDFDPNNHAGGTEIRNATEPDSFGRYYTGDTYCGGCGALLEKGREMKTACNAGTHIPQHHDAVAPTCSEDGIREYWECKRCGHLYADEDCTVEILTTVDPCTGHDIHPGLDTLKTTDVLSLMSKLNGQLDWTQLLSGDFSGLTVENLLGQIHLSDIDHCSDDTYHWSGCQRCGKTLYDLKDELEAMGAIIDDSWYEASKKTAHSGGTADCSNKAICSECGSTYGELGDHRYSSVVTDPTCTTRGYTTHTCTGCGEVIVDSYVNALGHNLNSVGKCANCGERFPNPFLDVGATKYYRTAVLWAYYSVPQITSGVSMAADTGYMYFCPDDGCTRAQAVTFLWRAAGCPRPTSTVYPFTDVPTNGDFKSAIIWAKENGITSGFPSGEFGVSYTVTRAQFMTFLWNYAGKPTPEGKIYPFTDLPSNANFKLAIMWAAENEITNGYETGEFGIGDTVTRAQAVTFLYKYSLMK